MGDIMKKRKYRPVAIFRQIIGQYNRRDELKSMRDKLIESGPGAAVIILTQLFADKQQQKDEFAFFNPHFLDGLYFLLEVLEQTADYRNASVIAHMLLWPEVYKPVKLRSNRCKILHIVSRVGGSNVVPILKQYLETIRENAGYNCETDGDCEPNSGHYFSMMDQHVAMRAIEVCQAKGRS